MSKVLGKVGEIGHKALTFSAACAVGIIGTGVGLGIKAQNSASRAVDAFGDGLQMALISSMSMSSFEEKLALHQHQASGGCKSRGGFDWAMASAHADNQAQYGG